MKTDVVKPKDIFYHPTRLVVPLFQRPYVWSRETQWEPLWQDIIRLIDLISGPVPNATHFLGAIVLQQVPTNLGSLPQWSVIDGQQRLTTLQLLLDALHAQLTARGYAALAEQIEPLVANPGAYLEEPTDRFKLWPTNRDRNAFAAVMGAEPPVAYTDLPKSRLTDAHQYFSDAIATWLDADSPEQRARMLVATVMDRVEIASIRLDANEDAQAIFETLNARGTPLSAADLIKNFVFQNMQATAGEAEKAYLNFWAEFETPWWEAEITTGRVKNSRASLFLWQWLIARTLKDFPIREVFTQFKYFVQTQQPDVASLLPELKASADRYRAVIEASQRSTGPLSRVELFNYRVSTLDSEVVRPLLIWLDEPAQEAIPEADKAHVLGMLESWFVRRALVKAASQGANRFIVDLLQALSGQAPEAVARATEEYLRSNGSHVGYWPGDDEVREALLGTPVYWRYLKGRLRMIFEALEDQKRGYPDGKRLAMGPVARNKATIEHIMPQNWRKNWGGDLSEEEQETWSLAIQQLGNLTIVTQALNSRISNGGWETKRQHFLHSDDVTLTKDAIAMAGDQPWSEALIARRSGVLIDAILKLWPAPPGHRGAWTESQVPASRDVDVAQLVADGALAASQELEPVSRAYGEIQAGVAQDGRIFVAEHPYDSPTAAAHAVTGTSVNGWAFWRLKGTDQTLSDVRAAYLASIGVSVPDGEPEATGIDPDDSEGD